jgi:glucosamine--fructose-6-phosphate aminotransferase (isomerizing)
MPGCMILGRGYNQATISETALKMTETCLISAQAFSAAGFQHGPIALVTGGYPCLLFAPDGKAFAPMAALAEKLRPKHPALICFAHDAAFLARSETAVRIPDAVAEWVSPLVYIVAAQLFVYWLSVERGSDPDAPRGLTKTTQTV